MPNIDEVETEALNFRKLLESCDKERTRLVTEDFPVMNCNLSSMLFIYHLFTRWPEIEVFGVNGIATDEKGVETISHYWVEVENIAIDLTADQYNHIDDSELNKEIIQERPFQSIYVGQKNSILPYQLFRIIWRDKYKFGFSSVGQDFIDEMEVGHSQLMELA
ncbi:MAG: hypothetical protein V7722_07430 [Porticoccus sp.]